jgi:hypothetical protein
MKGFLDYHGALDWGETLSWCQGQAMDPGYFDGSDPIEPQTHSIPTKNAG